MQDEMISSNEFEFSKSKRSFVFEFRTNFVIKGKCGFKMTIDSERFRACFVQGKTSRMHLEISAGYRLNEYSMPNEKNDALIEDAIEIAKQLMNYSKLQVIPIVINVNVCTVQREDEELRATLSRAITSRDLEPLNDLTSNLFSK